MKLIILYIIVTIINTFSVFGFFVRLIGIKTKKWSTTNSIFQIINLLPRTIGILQIPLITLYTETAINEKVEINILFFKGLIFFELVGIILGVLLLPYFLSIFDEYVEKLYEKSKLKNLFSKDVWIKNFKLKSIDNYTSFFNNYKLIKLNNLKLFVYNLFSAFLTSIALPACILTGYYLPNYRATIISSVSIIYGIATFITILLIDTKISVITDKTFHELIPYQRYKMILFDCLKGKFLGILFGIVMLPYFSNFLFKIFQYLLVNK